SSGDTRSGEHLGQEARVVTAVVSAGARAAKGKEEGFPAQEVSPPCRRILSACPSPAGGWAKNLQPLRFLTSASLGTAEDTQPPENRHLAPEGSRSSSNPEAVIRQLPPHNGERKQRKGKHSVNRKSGVRARARCACAYAFDGRLRSPTRRMADLREADEAELQRLVAAEQQKAQFTAQVHHFMELCWDKCVEKPGNRLDSRTENCLSSCVDRFIDTTLTITSRFAQIVQKGGQ
uniref:Mitochondrial import inner membrane translocase subunit Tim8 B n=1 Tax=Equus asinus TaxID=9793 RepID=A0A9L0J5J2_EQUAS